jgi:hypothetical protein
VDGFEQSEVENRLVLALVGLTTVNDLAQIKAVLQEMREWGDPVAGGLKQLAVR